MFFIFQHRNLEFNGVKQPVLIGVIFKINAEGVIIWQKNIGGSNNDLFNSIDATPDGNFVLSGYTSSNNGDVAGNHGSTDVWVAKIDGGGNLLWSKCYGGTLQDYGMSVKKTFTNDVLIGAHVFSSDGNVTGHNGYGDLWLFRLSSSGELIWEKTVGTSKGEYMGAVSFVSDNSYVLAGWSSLVNPPYSSPDGLLVKLGNASTIKGSVFTDLNTNGIRDTGEPSFDGAGIQIEKNGNRRTVYPYNGYFSLDVDTGSYTSTITINNPYYHGVPTSRTFTFNNYFENDSIFFAVQPVPGLKDLVIDLVPLTAARPGFTAQYKLVYYNNGTTVIPSGSVKLVKDSRTTLIMSNPAVSAVNDTLVWNFENLIPSDTASIQINFIVTPPPAVNNGDILRFVATISPVDGDLTPSNDTARLAQTVTGSYDPNDKTETHGGSITPDEISLGGYLNYVIRFQNTGTDTCFNMIIKDALSPSLDWNSLQMISASH